jgi:hypothetical protein
MRGNIERRLTSLEIESQSHHSGSCPRCTARSLRPIISNEELDERIKTCLSGNSYDADDEDEPLPDSSPSCPACRRFNAMSEEEIDAKLHKWMEWREIEKTMEAQE